MDDQDGTYAPQSPDLSAYNSEYAPDYSSNSYYGQQPQHYQQATPYQHQTSYLPQSNYDPNPYGAPLSQPVSHFQQPVMPRGSRGKQPAEDNDWAPEPVRAQARHGKQPKVEEECDKPAPGVEDGIEVKTKFPVARIKRIMQADEDVGKVSQVTPTAVSKALELFMISVITKSAHEAQAVSAKRVTAAHLKQAVAKDDQFDFLQDIIQKVPDAPPPKKEYDSEEGEGKKKRGGTRKRKKDTEWSRLIGGGSSPQVKKSNVNSLRLERFKRATEHLLQSWRKSQVRPVDKNTIEQLQTCLQTIIKILQEESHASAPYLCAEYAANVQIYKPATDLALSSLNNDVTHRTLRLLNILVDNEERSFLDDPTFAAAITGFTKRILASTTSSVENEALLFEVLFGIAAKLRLQPQYLRRWFKPGAQNGDQVSRIGSDQAQSRAFEGDFPLFYLLLDHVHHEGKVGEFARTGLLYIIESAARSDGLDKWIVESDLATLMASGLGALYSQLSRKLVISYAKDAVPSVVAFSDEALPLTAFDAVETSSPEFKESLTDFLNYLVFWQDILDNCTSHDVKETLLDHFEFLFLKQLLYPSLLESSDIDGGSVAVLTYVRCILQSVDHPDLVHRMLHYLLALAKGPVKETSSSRPATLARRRKSESLIRKQADSQEDTSPGLFTLLDMIVSGLGSSSQQTVAATLRLLSTILSTRHEYAISGLIRTEHVKEKGSKRSIIEHDRNIDTLLNMAEDLIDEDCESSYDMHLQDARPLLESHVCSVQLLALPSAIVDGREETDRNHDDWLHQVAEHKIDAADPLLLSMLSRLCQFFSNDVETNLALTQAISILVSCGHTKLDGWLLLIETGTGTTSNKEQVIIPQAQRPDIDNTTRTDDKRLSQGSSLGNKDMARNTEEMSPVLKALNSLVDQVSKFKKQIQDFDIYLAERKHVFKVGEEIETALKDVPSSTNPSKDTKAMSPSRKRPIGQVTSISERLMHDENSSNVSRSSSPRGRQYNASSAPTLASKLSHLQLSPSPNSSKGSSGYGSSPLRRDSFSSTPSKAPRTPIGPADALRRRIRIPLSATDSGKDSLDVGTSEVSSIRSESVEREGVQSEKSVEVSLSQILTNVVILQEFLLELAALVEVRAGLFGEVTFTT